MRDVGWHVLLASFFSQRDLDLTISTQSALLLSLLFPSSVCVPVQAHTTGRAEYLASLNGPTELPLAFLMTTFITGDKEQVVLRGPLPHRETA